MPPSCALLGGFVIGARVALLWQHNANYSYKLASIPRYDDIIIANARRGVRALLTGDRRVMGAFSTLLRRPGPRASQWWRSGDITRTQNVSQYMLVLAVCLVIIIIRTTGVFERTRACPL